MKRMPYSRLLSAAGFLLTCGACATDEAPEAPAAGVANPASVYCIEQGGRVEIRKLPDGGEVGYCVFPDGTECEEWAFFRGECKSKSRPDTSK